MNYIKIINSDLPIKENYMFSFKEFFSPKYPKNIEYECPECLIDAMQILRDKFGKWVVTSTIRPNDKFGLHINGSAIDSIPESNVLNVIQIFKKECLNYQNGRGSELIESLRKVGVNGFGIEGGCIHLDYRPDKNCVDSDSYGKYIVFFWEADGTANGKSTVVHKVN